MKATLGLKRICPKCSSRFYDLGKNPANCPKCGTAHDITAPVRTRRGKSKPAVAEVINLAGKTDEKVEQKAKAKPKKPVKSIEGIDLGEFEDIEPLDTEEEIEEMEEVEDIDSIGELEDLEETDKEEEGDEAAIEGEAAGPVLIDGVEEEEENEEEEDTKSSKKVAKDKKKGKR
jgi:uncharacterized protein (TIGR02300 family)